MLRPFRPELVGTRQGSVSTTDDKCIDAMPDEVKCSLSSAFNLAESGATRSADQSAANRGKATDVVPADLQEECQLVIGNSAEREKRTRMMYRPLSVCSPSPSLSNSPSPYVATKPPRFFLDVSVSMAVGAPAKGGEVAGVSA